MAASLRVNRFAHAVHNPHDHVVCVAHCTPNATRNRGHRKHVSHTGGIFRTQTFGTPSNVLDAPSPKPKKPTPLKMKLRVMPPSRMSLHHTRIAGPSATAVCGTTTGVVDADVERELDDERERVAERDAADCDGDRERDAESDAADGDDDFDREAEGGDERDTGAV